MIFWTDNSSSTVADNIKTDLLILDKDPADGLDDNTITSEAEYLLNFIGVRKKCCLNPHQTEATDFC